jgi:hypothetical protein
MTRRDSRKILIDALLCGMGLAAAATSAVMVGLAGSTGRVPGSRMILFAIAGMLTAASGALMSSCFQKKLCNVNSLDAYKRGSTGAWIAAISAIGTS